MPRREEKIPPLLSALVVCRARPEIEALSHVVTRISDCLDWSVPAHWSVPRACARRRDPSNLSHAASAECTRLLQRLAQREPPDLHRLYRAAQCSAGLVNAVRSDDVVVMEWLLTSYCPSAIVSMAMEEACRLGKVQLLEWVSTYCDAHNILWTSNFMDVAAENGHLPVLRWLQLHLSNVGCTGDALESAARNGHLDVVKWLREELNPLGYAPPPTTTSIDAAALAALRSGHIEIAKYLCDGNLKMLDVDYSVEMDIAARNSNWVYFRWIHEKQSSSRCATGAMNTAAASGNLEMLMWLHKNRSEGCTRQAMDYAAREGHLEIIQWLHANRKEGCTHRAMDYAADKGFLHIVQWLHINRNEGCTTSAMNSAAGGGHLEVVQWLHSNRREGCTTEAMDRAAINGHLAVLQWLHVHRSEGCTVKAMNLAAGNGHLHVVQWLHENRREGCTSMAMDLAASSNHLELVKWLHVNRREGCTTYAMDDAARGNHLEIVKWLHANRFEGCTKAAMDNASSFPLVKWLHENRHEGCTAKAMDSAVWAQDFQSILFLHTSRSEGCSHSVVHAFCSHENIEIFQWLFENYPERLDLMAIRMEYRERTYLNALLDDMGF